MSDCTPVPQLITRVMIKRMDARMIVTEAMPESIPNWTNFNPQTRNYISCAPASASGLRSPRERDTCAA
ncbi:MAG: hypothetical protein ACPGUY_09835, partial [Akkermansiaceae bacterium]